MKVILGGFCLLALLHLSLAQEQLRCGKFQYDMCFVENVACANKQNWLLVQLADCVKLQALFTRSAWTAAAINLIRYEEDKTKCFALTTIEKYLTADPGSDAPPFPPDASVYVPVSNVDLTFSEFDQLLEIGLPSAQTDVRAIGLVRLVIFDQYEYQKGNEPLFHIRTTNVEVGTASAEIVSPDLTFSVKFPNFFQGLTDVGMESYCSTYLYSPTSYFRTIFTYNTSFHSEWQARFGVSCHGTTPIAKDLCDVMDNPVLVEWAQFTEAVALSAIQYEQEYGKQWQGSAESLEKQKSGSKASVGKDDDDKAASDRTQIKSQRYISKYTSNKAWTL